MFSKILTALILAGVFFGATACGNKNRVCVERDGKLVCSDG